MITPTGTAAKITVDNESGKSTCSVLASSTHLQARVAGQCSLLIASRLTPSRSSSNQGNDFSKGLAEIIPYTFEAGGGEVVAWEAYAKRRDSDFTPRSLYRYCRQEFRMCGVLPDYYEKDPSSAGRLGIGVYRRFHGTRWDGIPQSSITMRWMAVTSTNQTTVRLH
jgi:branched-chain amino acid transport system substrate-binding protein